MLNLKWKRKNRALTRDWKRNSEIQREHDVHLLDHQTALSERCGLNDQNLIIIMMIHFSVALAEKIVKFTLEHWQKVGIGISRICGEKKVLFV